MTKCLLFVIIDTQGKELTMKRFYITLMNPYTGNTIVDNVHAEDCIEAIRICETCHPCYKAIEFEEGI